MVDFWSNHLNVTCPSLGRLGHPAPLRRARHPAARAGQVQRHAGRLGQAPGDADLPRQRQQLDKHHPNENYGRELLELHTVGVDARLHRGDGAVRRAAAHRSAPSTTTRRPTSTTRPSTRPARSRCSASPTPTRSTYGETVAEAYLRYLAHHPATARHIARKLAVRFVSDAPARRAGVAPREGLPAQRHRRSRPVLRAAVRLARRSARRPATRSRGRSRTWSPLSARSASAHRITVRTALRALQWMADDLGHAPLGWHPPERLPRRRGRVASRRRHARPLERAPQPARPAGGPTTCGHPPARSAGCCPPSRATHGALVDAAAAGLALPRPTATVRDGDLHLPRQGAGATARRGRRGARLAAAVRRTRCCSTAPAAAVPMTTTDDGVEADHHAAGADTSSAAGCPVAGCSRQPVPRRRLGVVGGLARDTATSRYAFAATAYTGDVLVVLSLRGGFDGLSAVVPAADPAYAGCAPGIGVPAGAAAPARPDRSACTLRSRRSSRCGTPGSSASCTRSASPTRPARTSRRWRRWSGPRRVRSLRTGWLDRVLGARRRRHVRRPSASASTPTRASLLGPGARAADDARRRLHALRGRRPGRAGPLDDRAARRSSRGARRDVAAPARLTAERARHGGRAQGRRLPAGRRRGLPEGRPRRCAHATWPDSSRRTSGCGSATVDFGDWDMHAGPRPASTAAGCTTSSTELGAALAAFAADLGDSMSTGQPGDALGVRSPGAGERQRRARPRARQPDVRARRRESSAAGCTAPGAGWHRVRSTPATCRLPTTTARVLAELLETRCGVSAGVGVPRAFPAPGSASPALADAGAGETRG